MVFQARSISRINMQTSAIKRACTELPAILFKVLAFGKVRESNLDASQQIFLFNRTGNSLSN